MFLMVIWIRSFWPIFAETCDGGYSGLCDDKCAAVTTDCSQCVGPHAIEAYWGKCFPEMLTRVRYLRCSESSPCVGACKPSWPYHNCSGCTFQKHCWRRSIHHLIKTYTRIRIALTFRPGQSMSVKNNTLRLILSQASISSSRLDRLPLFSNASFF